MTVQDQISLLDATRDRDASSCPPADLADVDALISDLAALVDAGLVDVRESVLGPARYGVVSDR